MIFDFAKPSIKCMLNIFLDIVGSQYLGNQKLAIKSNKKKISVKVSNFKKQFKG